MAEQPAPATVRWGEPVGGLCCGLEVPRPRPHVGERVRLGLHFRNVGSEPLRIYLLAAERFRSFQSTLDVCSATTGEPACPPRPSPPHGYVVSESDFHLIPQGQTLRFEQGLGLDARALQPGLEYRLDWTYENRIVEWPGGITTLDGPTRALFGGKRIPHIWTGRAGASATLRLAEPPGPNA